MKRTQIALVATMSTYALIACAPNSSAPAKTEATASALDHEVDRCVRFRERAHHCRETLVDPWVRVRVAHRPDLAARFDAPDGQAELRSVALEEFVADGSGPLAPREAKCRAVAERLPEALRPHTLQMDGCEIAAGCAAWTKCVVPAFSRFLDAAAELERAEPQ